MASTVAEVAHWFDMIRVTRSSLVEVDSRTQNSLVKEQFSKDFIFQTGLVNM
jgi:hypothetical protein